MPITTNREKTIARIFGTPLIIKGLTWLPVAQLVAWLGMSLLAGKRRPERTWAKNLGVGALTMPVVLGSEWCHNLAHAAAAQAVQKPMDELRIIGGMPRVVYYNIEDPSVTPRQHILRALGGPIFNALLLGLSWLLRTKTAPESLAREAADVSVGTNLFLSSVSFLPIPIIDGGPILKWSLVSRGLSPASADSQLRKVNGAMGCGFIIATVAAFRKRHWLLGSLLAQFAVLAFAFAFGWLHESRENELGMAR